MKRTLRSQLTLTIAGVALVTVALISILANAFISWQFRQYIARQQSRQTDELVSSLSQQYYAGGDRWDVDFLHTIGMNALYDGYIIHVKDRDGASVWDAENHDMSLCAQVMADISERMRVKYPRINGEFTSREYDLAQQGSRVGSVIISYYGPYFLSESDFQFLDSLNAILLGASALSLLLSVLIAGWAARRISRPVTAAAGIAARMSQGDYSARFAGSIQTAELDQLAAAMDRLARSLRDQETLRKQLTADVAHELRTPLTTVGTHLEAMLEGVWEPTPQRLQSCQEEIGRIAGLIKDLESLARAEGEAYSLNRAPTDLLELSRDACPLFEWELAQKDIHLQVEGEPVTALVDSDRMRQVLGNLLSNAVKYTPQGGCIRVRVSRMGDQAVIAVKDSGIGISAEHLPHLFERFYRVDKSRNRATGGAGIGLAVVKAIVEAHGGSVAVKSTPGEGSVFSVLLPL